jgi:hypothetical protein
MEAPTRDQKLRRAQARCYDEATGEFHRNALIASLITQAALAAVSQRNFLTASAAWDDAGRARARSQFVALAGALWDDAYTRMHTFVGGEVSRALAQDDD